MYSFKVYFIFYFYNLLFRCFFFNLIFNQLIDSNKQKRNHRYQVKSPLFVKCIYLKKKSLVGNKMSIMSQSHKPNEKEQKVELPSRVAQWYYKHGLFLSSYPTCASSIAIFIVIFSW